MGYFCVKIKYERYIKCTKTKKLDKGYWRYVNFIHELLVQGHLYFNGRMTDVVNSKRKLRINDIFLIKIVQNHV